MTTEPADGGGELTLVLTTVADVQAGERLVGALLDERFVACGNLLPGLVSLYRWEGRRERADETLVLLKTRAALVPRLFQRIAELHPYEVPELVALPISAVSEAYGRWAMLETTEVTA